MSSLEPYVLEYARKGLAVFPLTPGSKIPLIARTDGGRGCLDAATDIDQVRAWWRRCPTANIGLATGGRRHLLVVDMDVEGEAGWQALLGAHGTSSVRTRVARTPSGGLHYYFWAPLPLGNSVGRLCPGVDTRGVGGYVVAPPSQIGASTYEWIDTSRVAPLPEWLVERLRPVARPLGSPLSPRVALRESRLALRIIAEEAARVATAPKGERNMMLFKSGAALAELAAGGELRIEVAVEELLAAAVANGLSRREAEATILSAVCTGRRNPRQIGRR